MGARKEAELGGGGLHISGRRGAIMRNLSGPFSLDKSASEEVLGCPRDFTQCKKVKGTAIRRSSQKRLPKKRM